MIRHVVCIPLTATDVEERREQALALRDRLESLRDVDPGIITIDVHFDLGVDRSHWPLILVADFDTHESLEVYQSHPRHREVVEWMNAGVVSARSVVDVELP